MLKAASAAPLRVPVGAAGAPHPTSPHPLGCSKTPARASRGLPPHFSWSRWISSSSCSNRPGNRLREKSNDSLQSHPWSLIRSRACPATNPEVRRARPPNAPLPRREQRRSPPFPGRRRHSPQPQLPSAGGVGGVAGWRMLLPTEGRGRNGNRNHCRRRLTEPSAPVTEGERKAARARQSLTARDRARAASRARDPEQRRPHSARRGKGRVDWGLGGGGKGRGPGAERTRPLGSAGDNARTRRGGSDN